MLNPNDIEILAYRKEDDDYVEVRYQEDLIITSELYGSRTNVRANKRVNVGANILIDLIHLSQRFDSLAFEKIPDIEFVFWKPSIIQIANDTERNLVIIDKLSEVDKARVLEFLEPIIEIERIYNEKIKKYC